jgi:hypothetical protein
MRGFGARRTALAGALFAAALAAALASCGSGGDVVAILSGSGDGTESFRLDKATNLNYTFSITNDEIQPCVAMQGIRMNRGARGGQGITVAPLSSGSVEGGMHLAAGDWLMDFQMKSQNSNAGNLLACHWRMVLTTTDEQHPDIPKTGCVRPGKVGFPDGPICGQGDAPSWMKPQDTP